jgi:hypothetical protein
VQTALASDLAVIALVGGLHFPSVSKSPQFELAKSKHMPTNQEATFKLACFANENMNFKRQRGNIQFFHDS